MSSDSVLDSVGRTLQNCWGERVTGLLQNVLGPAGSRIVRHLLGRSANHQPDISVPLARVGVGNDSWMLCPTALAPGAIVYSVGVGTEIDFDLQLIDTYGVRLWAFDPTPNSVDWISRKSLPPSFEFVPVGIGGRHGWAVAKHLSGVQCELREADDGVKADCPMTTLEAFAHARDHTRIGLLKLNIEGGEYSVIETFPRLTVPIDQVIVEFHHRFPGHSLIETEKAVQTLRSNGFLIAYIDPNGKEYCFVHKRIC